MSLIRWSTTVGKSKKVSNTYAFHGADGLFHIWGEKEGDVGDGFDGAAVTMTEDEFRYMVQQAIKQYGEKWEKP